MDTLTTNAKTAREFQAVLVAHYRKAADAFRKEALTHYDPRKRLASQISAATADAVADFIGAAIIKS